MTVSDLESRGERFRVKGLAFRVCLAGSTLCLQCTLAVRSQWGNVRTFISQTLNPKP